MKFLFVGAALLSIVLYFSLSDRDIEAEVTPEKAIIEDEITKILNTARWASVDKGMHGALRKNGQSTPISIFLRDGHMQLTYKNLDGSRKRYHLRVKGNKLSAYKISSEGETTPVLREEFRNKILNSDLSLDICSLFLLMGNERKIVGEERIGALDCYKIRIILSDTMSEYKISYAWVSKKKKMLVKVIGYNKTGKPLVKIQLTDIIITQEGKMPKKWRVESIDPKINKSLGTTYMEF